MPEPDSPQLTNPQSPPQQLFLPSKRVEISAEQLPPRHLTYHNARESLFTSRSDSAIRVSDPIMAPPRLHIYDPGSVDTLKRRASPDNSAVSNGGLKV
jgi:hypothetical protein